MTTEWITTSEAAALLGYSPEHFRRKFAGLIPCLRMGQSNRRWDKAAVLALLSENVA